MKNKYLYIKVSIMAIIILSIILWGIVYFIPTNKYIYNSNKKIKELKRIVAKYKRDKKKFHKTDLFEQKLMQIILKKFKNKFYVVKSKEDMINFYRKIYDHIQYTEKKMGDSISELQITTDSPRSRLPGRYRSPGSIENDTAGNPLLQMIPKLEEKIINLSFNGDIKDVSNFINHITWSSLFISINELEVSKDFKMALKVYFINNRIKKNE